MSWSIAEVAKALGVTARTLRHYHAIGLLELTLEHQMATHLLVGMVAFIALAVALLKLARRLTLIGHRIPARISAVAAAFVIAANIATATGVPYPSVVLAIGVGTGMLGLSVAAATIRRSA